MEMDTPALVALGALIALLVMGDLVWTVVSVAGRGPLTSAVARGLYRTGRFGNPSHRRRRILGAVIAVAVPLTWLGLILAGFTMMFMADDEAVVNAATQEPVGWIGRLGYAMGGLAGAGASLVAGTPTWELVNNVAAMTGLAMVTLALTYLLQTVTAVSSERATASTIAGLGSSPADAVAGALESDGDMFSVQMALIAQGISTATQHHLSLPAQQFFHSGDPDTTMSVALARFDEMLTILDCGLHRSFSPLVRSGRSAVDGFMRTLALPSDGSPPPPPDLSALRRVTEDVADDEAFTARVESLARRRSRLHAYVTQEGWTWESVWAGPDRGADDI